MGRESFAVLRQGGGRTALSSGHFVGRFLAELARARIQKSAVSGMDMQGEHGSMVAWHGRRWGLSLARDRNEGIGDERVWLGVSPQHLGLSPMAYAATSKPAKWHGSWAH